MIVSRYKYRPAIDGEHFDRWLSISPIVKISRLSGPANFRRYYWLNGIYHNLYSFNDVLNSSTFKWWVNNKNLNRFRYR